MDRLEQPGEQLRHRPIAVPSHHLLHAGRPEHASRAVIRLEDAVRDQAEDVAGRQRQRARWVHRGVLHEAHRKRRRVQPLAVPAGGSEVQQRALARRVVVNLVAVDVEHAEECRHEVLFRQVLDELVVDLREDRVEAGTEAQRDAQHRRQLRRAQGRPDAVARGVAEQHEEPVVVDGHEIERVAARLGRPGRTGRPCRSRACCGITDGSVLI